MFNFKNFTSGIHFVDRAVNMSVKLPEDGSLRDETYSNSDLSGTNNISVNLPVSYI
jgi:hypothetical protein